MQVESPLKGRVVGQTQVSSVTVEEEWLLPYKELFQERNGQIKIDKSFISQVHQVNDLMSQNWRPHTLPFKICRVAS